MWGIVWGMGKLVRVWERCVAVWGCKGRCGECGERYEKVWGRYGDVGGGAGSVEKGGLWPTGGDTIFMLLAMGAPANFLNNSSRKTSKQTFGSIPRAPHPQIKGAKLCLYKHFFAKVAYNQKIFGLRPNLLEALLTKFCFGRLT